MSFRCPSCGRDAGKGPYCRFCGNPLDEDVDALSKDSYVVEESEEVEESNVTSIQNFGIDLHVHNKSSILTLLVRSEFDIITDELDQVIEQSRATRHALELKQADTAILSARAETLRIRFDELKARRRMLEQAPKSINAEELLLQLEETKEKLVKLKEASKSLDKDIYEEQRILLVTEIKKLTVSIKEELRTLQKDAKELEKKEREFQKSMSKLDARFKIGDVSKTAYTKSSELLLKQIRLVSETKRKLDELISKIKENTK